MTNKIDLSILKVGDTVVHRNGGRSVAIDVENHKNKTWILFDGGEGCWFRNIGKFPSHKKESPFDIIAIEIEKAAPKKNPLEEWLDTTAICNIEHISIYQHILNLGKAINETLKMRDEK